MGTVLATSTVGPPEDDPDTREDCEGHEGPRGLGQKGGDEGHQGPEAESKQVVGGDSHRRFASKSTLRKEELDTTGHVPVFSHILSWNSYLALAKAT